MDNNIFVLKEKNFAIDAESMKEINEYFNINIHEYGVTGDDSVRRELSKEEQIETLESKIDILLDERRSTNVK